MLKFLKMTVADDVITMEEVLEVLAEVAQAKEVQLQEEKVALHQEKRVQADLEVIEIQLLEKVDLVVEVTQEAQLQEEKVVLHQTDLEQKVQLTEHQDVPKALVIHQDQEDQEKSNIHC